jgi:hypothetical protein
MRTVDTVGSVVHIRFGALGIMVRKDFHPPPTRLFGTCTVQTVWYEDHFAWVSHHADFDAL